MNGDEQRMRRIAIFGKSHELWPVAALLGRDLPTDMEMVVVEDCRAVDPVAATVRLDDPFLARLGIGADELRMTDSAVLSLGTELRDWQGEGSHFFLTGSGSLPAIDDVAIHQIMLRAALSYDQPERLSYLYQPFRLPARAAEAGKFAFQSTDPRSPLSMLRPTVQIDRAHYIGLFEHRLGSGRTEIVKARPKAMQTSSDNGAIYRIELDNGGVIEADFYIDVTGAVGRLAGGFSRSDWHSIAAALPFDRLLSARNPEAPAGTERHVVAQAINGGLLVTAALRDTSVVQLLYSSSHLTGEAEQRLVGREARVALFEPGYVGQPWIGNLARLGSASASFGPFLSSDMTILQRQAIILADHLPTRRNMTVEAREYNRRHLTAAEQVRDFTLLPFALNRRNDVPWFDIQERKMPESLARRIDQFRSRGRFVAFEGEIFDEQSWIDLMIGFGIVPDRIDPMARSLDMTEMARRLKNLTGAFDQALATIPFHGDAKGDPGTTADR